MSATEWRAPGHEHDPSVRDDASALLSAGANTSGFWRIAAKMPTTATLRTKVERSLFK